MHASHPEVNIHHIKKKVTDRLLWNVEAVLMILVMRRHAVHNYQLTTTEYSHRTNITRNNIGRHPTTGKTNSTPIDAFFSLNNATVLSWYSTTLCNTTLILTHNYIIYDKLSFKNKWYIPNTHPFNGPFPGIPRWAGNRKVKPIWILLKQETVSGSGISWAICKSAPRSRQITTPAPHHSVFYRSDALPAAQPTASKNWRHKGYIYQK